MTELILASSSRYRKALLEQLQTPFRCHSPDIDESPLPDEAPLALAQRLAAAKAGKVAEQYREHLIIGSDQVVECDGAILAKPGGFEAARRQLQQQSGKAVKFHTGLCLLNSASGVAEQGGITTVAHFRQLSDREIERYLHREEPYDCAGSFKSEQLGISLLRSLDGPDPSALVGLPLIRLCEMLRKQGLQLP